MLIIGTCLHLRLYFCKVWLQLLLRYYPLRFFISVLVFVNSISYLYENCVYLAISFHNRMLLGYGVLLFFFFQVYIYFLSVSQIISEQSFKLKSQICYSLNYLRIIFSYQFSRLYTVYSSFISPIFIWFGCSVLKNIYYYNLVNAAL